MTALVNNMTTEIAMHEICFGALERLILPCEESVKNVQNSNYGNKASTIELHTSVKRLVNIILDKNKRKCTVIVFNMPDIDSFNDDKRNLSQLMCELDLNESMNESISRLERYSSKRPRPLKLQLTSERCVFCFLDAAKLLKYMETTWPKFAISPTRTQGKSKSQQDIMNEL